jgi:hypothetical protein
MKPQRIVVLGLVTALLASLGACATNRLEGHSFEGEPMRLIVRVAPGARVRADYSVRVNPDDPVGTVLSIGSTIAKATQVEKAQEKLDVAMRNLDIQTILQDEVGAYFEEVIEVRLTESRTSAAYVLNVLVEEYGIEASGPGSSIEFVLRGTADLFDASTDRLIWDARFRRSERFSPHLFGLPGSAGNVVSAAMLNELTEEQIAAGIERITRDAAWEISGEFEEDLAKARRRSR